MSICWSEQSVCAAWPVLQTGCQARIVATPSNTLGLSDRVCTHVVTENVDPHWREQNSLLNQSFDDIYTYSYVSDTSHGNKKIWAVKIVTH